MLDVISVGDANIDMLMHVLHHPDLDPRGDRGSGVRGSTYNLGPGGVAANVAAVMAKLGNRAGFIGVVGDDDLGRTFCESLTQRGIDIRHVRAIPGHQMSLLCCFEDAEGQSIFYACPGPRRIPAECLDRAYLASARMIFLAGNMLTQDEVTGKRLLAAVKSVREDGAVVALDPSKYWLNPGLAWIVREVIAEAHILLPNRHEAELLTGRRSPEDAAGALLGDGPELVALKLGAEGCVILTAEEELRVPPFQTEARAFLGAGDAFNGGFLHGYLRDWPLEEMARFANATASLKLRTPGTQAGLPLEVEVMDFLSQQRDNP
jgi:sugar/nucleoside kinase (ribokinase family)